MTAIITPATPITTPMHDMDTSVISAIAKPRSILMNDATTTKADTLLPISASRFLVIFFSRSVYTVIIGSWGYVWNPETEEYEKVTKT